MPQSIMIGLLVLGGVLLLIAITGGNFKIFDAEVDSPVSSTPVRLLSGLLGLAFIVGALLLNKPAAPSNAQSPANNPASSSSSASPAASGPASGPAPSAGSNSSPAVQPVAAAGGQQASEATPGGSSTPDPAISSSEYAIVFDPPTNVRMEPTTSSGVLCSVTSRTSIRILGSEGNWYRTDVCGNGQTGYIYRNQVKF
jgi:uncharacterized protein YgiM (DUF1202 family)